MQPLRQPLSKNEHAKREIKPGFCCDFLFRLRRLPVFDFIRAVCGIFRYLNCQCFPLALFCGSVCSFSPRHCGQIYCYRFKWPLPEGMGLHANKYFGGWKNRPAGRIGPGAAWGIFPVAVAALKGVNMLRGERAGLLCGRPLRGALPNACPHFRGA